MRSRDNALHKGLSIRKELVKQLLEAHKVPDLAADFIHYLEANLKNWVFPESKMHLVYDLAIQNSNSFQRVKEESGIVYRGFSNLRLSSCYLPGDMGSDAGIHSLTYAVSDPMTLSSTPHPIFLCPQLGPLLALPVHNIIQVSSV